MRRIYLAISFVILTHAASAQVGGISSITVRDDGNTEQQTTAGGETTITVRQKDPNVTVQMDKDRHITNVTLPDNCSAKVESYTQVFTWVCRLYKGKPVLYEVVWLDYSCHEPDSNVITIQKRIATKFVRLEDSGHQPIPCPPERYEADRQDALRYGETIPQYTEKVAEPTKEPEKKVSTTTGSGDEKKKRPRKAERRSSTHRRAARVETHSNESSSSALEHGIGLGLSIGLGGGRRERGHETDRGFQSNRLRRD